MDSRVHNQHNQHRGCGDHNHREQDSAFGPVLEHLEPRLLLSAVADISFHTDVISERVDLDAARVLELDGIDDYVNVPDDPSLKPPAVTVAFWINPDIDLDSEVSLAPLIYKLDESDDVQNTVRGYESRSLGPKDSGLTPEPIGGDRRVLANAEILSPVFGGTNKKDKRLLAFFDAGMVYGPDEDLELGSLRYSAGVAFQWYNILGPLTLSYAFPLNEEEGDEIQEFQISLGRLFR